MLGQAWRQNIGGENIDNFVPCSVLALGIRIFHTYIGIGTVNSPKNRSESVLVRIRKGFYRFLKAHKLLSVHNQSSFLIKKCFGIKLV